MSVTDWSDQKSLDQFHSDFMAAAAHVKTLNEKIALVETANVDLTEKLDAMRARSVSLEPVSEDNRQVLRSYVIDPDHAEASGITHTRGGGISTRQPVAASKSEGHAVRMYGMVTEDGEWVPGLLDDPATHSEWHAKAKSLAQTLSVVNWIGNCKGSGMIRSGTARKRFVRHMAKGPGVIAKIFTDAAGFGEELLPEVTLADVQMAAEQARGLEAAFAVRELPAGGSHKIPFLNLAGVRFFVASPQTNDDIALGQTSSARFDDRTMDAVTLRAVVAFDMFAREDAFVEHGPLMTQAMSSAAAAAVEDAIVNGDTASVHQDTLATWTGGGRWLAGDFAADHRKAWIGLRARAFDISNAAAKNSATTAADYLSDVASLDAPFGFGDLVLVPSNKYYLSQLIKDASLLTVDKRGMGATILNAQIAELGGYPLIRSGFMTDDLATSGLYTGSGTTGGRLVFDRSRFEVARRAGLRMYLEEMPSRGGGYITLTNRLVFRTIDDSMAKNVHYGYNLPIA